MHLEKVLIKNFRSLRDLSVTLTAGLNVFVGENNIGKTAFFDAIRAALGSVAATGESIKLVKEDRHRLPSGLYANDPISVSLIFGGMSSADHGQFIDLLNYDPAKPQQSTAQLNFRWQWNEKAERFSSNRWGGAADYSEGGVPEDVLQMIPITLLGALRDATTSLMPGRNSRLGNLLRLRAGDEDKTKLEDFIKTANAELEKNALVSKTQTLISQTLQKTTGAVMSQKAAIKTAEPEFDKIVQSLRLVLERTGVAGAPAFFDELRSNGLGFNNLIFIATIMLELNASKSARLPLLLVEEPEAHLHPQLQTLLADFLSNPKELSISKVQTLITSHSPTIAAHVSPQELQVLHRDSNNDLRCASLSLSNLLDNESRQLRRMLDVTKATMLFAKSVILVEGITEALLIPVLAKRTGYNLDQMGISVVPVCGVAFETIAKLYGGECLRIKLAILTDGDSGAERADDGQNKKWQERVPKVNSKGELRICERVEGLLASVAGNDYVKVFHSDVTLEYSLAAAAKTNPPILCDVWEAQFKGTPRSFGKKALEACNGIHADEILAIWRGICLSDTTCSKADFAQSLADYLDGRDENEEYKIKAQDFAVPQYILNAFDHVTS